MHPLTRSALALLLSSALGTAAVPSYGATAHPGAGDPVPVDPFVPGIDEDPELTAAWQRWQSKDIDDYVITVGTRCFCAPTDHVRSRVRDDRIVRVQRGEARLAPRRGDSMDGIYATIRDALADAESVQVEYTRRGVPELVVVDPDQDVFDDETFLSVSVRRA